jgi:hypothetical protein
MRYRVEYLHLTTSGRLTFTVETPGLDGMARSAGNAWLNASGLHLSDFAFLSVVALGEDGHAHTRQDRCDILSIVRDQHRGDGTLHEDLSVGRELQQGPAGDSPDLQGGEGPGQSGAEGL